MHAFVLAGGFATRLWPLTERRAKPLLPLAGKPLLTHITEKIPRDISITVSTNAVFAQDIQAWADEIDGRTVTVITEDAGHDGEKLGALGAVRKWIIDERIDDDILLLAGDNYMQAPMDAFLQSFRGNALVAAHDIQDEKKASQFGTIVVDGKNGNVHSVTHFEEKPLLPRSTLVSTGWWVLPEETIPVLDSYAQAHPDNVGGIFEELLAKKMDVDCVALPGLWKDIGSFEAYMDIHQQILGQKHLIDASAAIDDTSMLSGSIDVGPMTTVKKSTLIDCILFGESTIDDCVLERCIIDAGCTLKGIDLSGKMLRAGTRLIANH